MELLEEHRCFDGQQQRWRHHSPVLNCAMTFSIFLPPERETPPPVLYWLSGLTCNDENFTTKAGAQRIAAELGIALVMPDTSPRGDEAANDDGYDLGQGAGFYLNATEAPRAAHYRMYDYLRDELPALIRSEFSVGERCAVSGHSMGGHGALIMALKNPGRYASVSAFAPIVNPSQSRGARKRLPPISARMNRHGTLGQLRADAGQPAGGRRADAYRSGRQRSIPCRTAAAGGTGGGRAAEGTAVNAAHPARLRPQLLLYCLVY